MQKPMDLKRLESEDLGAIQTWYNRLEALLHRHNIQPNDFYNFDEIGFMCGQGRKRLVLTVRGLREARILGRTA